jgi:hypothetical protein
MKCDSLNMMSHILSSHAQSTSSSPIYIIPFIPTQSFLTDPSVKMSLPAPPDGPWKSARAPRYSIHPIPLSLFEALEAGDLERASSLHRPLFQHLHHFLSAKRIADCGVGDLLWWRERPSTCHGSQDWSSTSLRGI